jgi:CRP/FNR family nitrogen fixation transcriptional regulator
MNPKLRKTKQSVRRPPSASVSPANAIDQMCAPTSYLRNEAIFGEGEPADYLYKLESGCVRAYRTLDNDRRQLVAFYLAGDLFGLDARDLHTISTEATTPSKVRVIKRKALMARGGDVAITKHLLDLTAAELRRTQNHNLLLRKGAQERVIGFLREMAERGQHQGEFELHMTRRDIADYLGLTIETVSRTLTRLESDAAISLPSPWRVVLHDPAALN